MRVTDGRGSACNWSSAEEELFVSLHLGLRCVLRIIGAAGATGMIVMTGWLAATAPNSDELGRVGQHGHHDG